MAIIVHMPRTCCLVDIGSGDCFVFAIERPVALREGIEFLMATKENERQIDAIQNLDDFKLT